MRAKPVNERPFAARSATLALLLLLAALLSVEAAALTYTADEPAYVAGGYALLAHGADALELLAQRGYPPLMPLLDGLLIYIGDPSFDLETMEGWPDAFDQFAHSFLTALPSFDRAVFVSRMPTVWLCILLAALVARWAGDLFSHPAGLLAPAILVLDPTLLAHGGVATSDVGVTLFGAAALYTAWRWAQGGGWRWSIGLGVLLGLTLLSKLSGFVWAGCASVVVVSRLLGRREGEACVRRTWHAVVAALLAVLTLWAGHAFRWGTVSGIAVPVPMPTYSESGRYLRDYVSVSYALDQRFTRSQWWYFPLAFIVKNPLPLLLIWSLGIGGLLVMDRDRRALALMLFPVVYSCVALFEGMNIGYRHMLPIHPFLTILAGGGLALWWHSGPRSRRWAMAPLLLWLSVATLRVYPNSIAFFSVLVGGPDQGYHYLVDSNLDWGQRTDRQERLLLEHPELHTDAPEAKLRPAPGRYAIGASELQGVGIGDSSAFGWFRHWTPTTHVSYSLLLFDVPAMSIGWVAQCGSPSLPLDEASLEEGLGRPGIRSVGFDCTQSWLYPDGGVSSGIYAIALPTVCDLVTGVKCSRSPFKRDRPSESDVFLQRRLARARLSFVERQGPSPYALFEFVPFSGGDPESDEVQSVEALLPVAAVPRLDDRAYAVRADQVPSALTGFRLCGSRSQDGAGLCVVEGPLSLLGTTVVPEEASLDVETWWRVTEPITRSFSIMAHLITDDGELVGNADGLGVWLLTLQAGDVFVQRHSFAEPQTSQPLWLRTGAYWLDTMERWPVDNDADVILVRLLVP